ncbi:hypothetical protein Fot_24352 [Forsythia ovata]|uniref:Uncharacterized protein n=1 Tax=Forsythia ovata TaxID=205694 RepID=A0ABD1U5Z0_9LAMI
MVDDMEGNRVKNYVLEQDELEDDRYEQNKTQEVFLEHDEDLLEEDGSIEDGSEEDEHVYVPTKYHISLPVNIGIMYRYPHNFYEINMINFDSLVIQQETEKVFKGTPGSQHGAHAAQMLEMQRRQVAQTATLNAYLQQGFMLLPYLYILRINLGSTKPVCE